MGWRRACFSLRRTNEVGNNSDAIDARKPAELLGAGILSAVHCGDSNMLEIQCLVRSYNMLRRR
jgi:hypothetical protein